MALIMYHCERCNTRFERLVNSSTSAIDGYAKARCPDCGRMARRKWHGSSVRTTVKRGRCGNYEDGYTGER